MSFWQFANEHMCLSWFVLVAVLGLLYMFVIVIDNALIRAGKGKPQ